MSESATTTSDWDDTLLLLQRDSEMSGMLLSELARMQPESGTGARENVWCVGRGWRSSRYRRFAWQYWTRRDSRGGR